MTIRFLIRTELGWDALDEQNNRVATYGGGLLFACQHWRVRRLMFGSYTSADGRKLEGWEVEPIHAQDTAD